jgi:hypothetical protein
METEMAEKGGKSYGSSGFSNVSARDVRRKNLDPFQDQFGVVRGEVVRFNIQMFMVKLIVICPVRFARVLHFCNGG